ncbi:unnamed protein product, partial [Nesidiocoris tenuis]
HHNAARCPKNELSGRYRVDDPQFQPDEHDEGEKERRFISLMTKIGPLEEGNLKFTLYKNILQNDQPPPIVFKEAGSTTRMLLLLESTSLINRSCPSVSCPYWLQGAISSSGALELAAYILSWENCSPRLSLNTFGIPSRQEQLDVQSIPARICYEVKPPLKKQYDETAST